MSWFELRYMLKGIGLLQDYKVYQKLSNMDFGKGLVEISIDKHVEHIWDNMDRKANAFLYIEHLQPGQGDVEMPPDYCKADKPESVIPNKLCISIDDGGEQIGVVDGSIEGDSSESHGVAGGVSVVEGNKQVIVAGSSRKDALVDIVMEESIKKAEIDATMTINKQDATNESREHAEEGTSKQAEEEGSISK